MTVIALLVGFVLAAMGGERFVRGAVGLSVAVRLPAGIIGATVVAFATSSPELAVAISSSTTDEPELALGDALGATMMNLGVVLGGATLLVGLSGRWSDIRRDLPTGLAALALLTLVAADGTVSRSDAIVLLLLFGVWVVWISVDARRERSVSGETLGDPTPRRAVVDLAAGLVLLTLAGRAIVTGADGVGTALGWDPFVVGTLAVAIGTTSPEMVTAVVAARRGHAEVGIGAVLGSNVFNVLFVVGVAAAITPIPVVWSELSVTAGFAVAATLLALPDRAGRLTRWRGLLLVATFVVWVGVVLIAAPR